MNKGILVTMSWLVILAMAGCSPGEDSASGRFVDFGVLVSKPQHHHGRSVCTTGVYVSGWETSALGASTHEADGAIYLTEPVIWIEGAEIRSRSDWFITQTTPPAEFCKVKVCGLFEYGGDYGHAAAYDYQLRGEVN